MTECVKCGKCIDDGDLVFPYRSKGAGALDTKNVCCSRRCAEEIGEYFREFVWKEA